MLGDIHRRLHHHSNTHVSLSKVDLEDVKGFRQLSDEAGGGGGGSDKHPEMSATDFAKHISEKATADRLEAIYLNKDPTFGVEMANKGNAPPTDVYAPSSTWDEVTDMAKSIESTIVTAKSASERMSGIVGDLVLIIRKHESVRDGGVARGRLVSMAIGSRGSYDQRHAVHVEGG